MKNKGFTLVELLAVIVILAMVSVIVFPNINKIIMSSRQSLHDEQIMDIEKAGEKWATDNNDKLDPYHLNISYIGLSDLQNMGYLEKEKIVDPLTKEKMDGCVQIKYDIELNKYTYAYEENTCNSYAEKTNTTDDSYGYMIYSYDSASKEVNLISSEDKKYIPLGLEIYNSYLNNGILHSEGEEVDGLYETDDEYVFKGSNPLNYVKVIGKNESGNLEGTLFRILSINKNDYSLKLIKASSVATNAWDEKGEYDLNSATSNKDILVNQKYNNTKILTTDYLSGEIDGASYSIQTLKSELNSKSKTSLTISMLSILDFVNASARYECATDYRSSLCNQNNYISNMIGTGSAWTININGSSAWYIGNDGLNVSSSTENRQIYPVITLGSNVYNSNKNATGSDSVPFEVK